METFLVAFLGQYEVPRAIVLDDMPRPQPERPYPTWSEAVKYAAGEWKRAHAPQTLLAALARFHTWRRG